MRESHFISLYFFTQLFYPVYVYPERFDYHYFFDGWIIFLMFSMAITLFLAVIISFLYFTITNKRIIPAFPFNSIKRVLSGKVLKNPVEWDNITGFSVASFRGNTACFKISLKDQTEPGLMCWNHPEEVKRLLEAYLTINKHNLLDEIPAEG